MNYYLDGDKITTEQLKAEFEKIKWNYNWATVIRICKITNKSIYFTKQEFKLGY